MTTLNSLPATGLTQLSAFNYRGVRLLPSRWQQQFQATRDYYFAIPNDDILRDFRLRAGMWPAGRPLGGWYSGDNKGQWHSAGDIFCTFGQWLSGYARMAAATGDAVELDLPLPLQFQPVDAQHPRRAALLKGPVVLVADAGPLLIGDQGNPVAWIEPVESPLHLRTRGANPDRNFQPFYELPENVPYWMYHNLQAA